MIEQVLKSAERQQTFTHLSDIGKGRSIFVSGVQLLHGILNWLLPEVQFCVNCKVAGFNWHGPHTVGGGGGVQHFSVLKQMSGLSFRQLNIRPPLGHVGSSLQTGDVPFCAGTT